MFFKMDKKNHKFKHGQIFRIDNKRKIVASYHPSPRNVNTKRIDENTMVDLLRKVKKMHQSKVYKRL